MPKKHYTKHLKHCLPSLTPLLQGNKNKQNALDSLALVRIQHTLCTLSSTHIYIYILPAFDTFSAKQCSELELIARFALVFMGKRIN